MRTYIVAIAAFLLPFFGIAQNNNSEVSILLEQLVSDNTVAGVAAGYSIDGKVIDQSSLNLRPN